MLRDKIFNLLTLDPLRAFTMLSTWNNLGSVPFARHS